MILQRNCSFLQGCKNNEHNPVKAYCPKLCELPAGQHPSSAQGMVYCSLMEQKGRNMFGKGCQHFHKVFSHFEFYSEELIVL